MGSLVAELAEKLSSATNNFDIDEGTIYVNTSADTVGIGTTSPGSKLDVQGTLQVGVNDTGHDVKFFGATAGKYMEWDESADQLDVTGSFDVTGNSTMVGTLTVGVDDTGHDVKFFGATSGSYMLWDESQDDLIIGGTVSRVGIGITSPSFQLDLQNAGADGIRVAAYSTTASNTARLYLTHSNNGTAGSQTAVDAEDVLGQIIFQGSNGSAFVSGALIQAVADETFSGTAQGSYLTFNTVDNTTTGLDERMRIDHDGKIGIGTTAPGSKLHVEGTDPGSGNALIEAKLTNNTNNPVMLLVNENVGGNQTDDHGLVIDNRGGAGNSHSLRIRNNTAEILMVKANGKIGIGTTAPAELLDIVASTTSALRLENTGDAGTVIRMDADRSAEDGGLGSIVFGWNGTTVAQVSGSAGADTSNKDDGELTFSTTESGGSLTERMRIDSAGNVGIGTSSPAFKLAYHISTMPGGDAAISISGSTGGHNHNGALYKMIYTPTFATAKYNHAVHTSQSASLLMRFYLNNLYGTVITIFATGWYYNNGAVTCTKERTYFATLEGSTDRGHTEDWNWSQQSGGTSTGQFTLNDQQPGNASLYTDVTVNIGSGMYCYMGLTAKGGSLHHNIFNNLSYV